MQSGGSGMSEEALQRQIQNALGEVVGLMAGKTAAQKAELLHSMIRLAGKVNSQIQSEISHSSSDLAERLRRRKREVQRRVMIRQLLKTTCMQGAPGGPDQLLVYGMEDVEQLIAPFSLSSLHGGSSSGSSGSRLIVDSSFDADDPLVSELAAKDRPTHEQRRFKNAVWWAARKERLRAEAPQSFWCTVRGADGVVSAYPCNLGEMQEVTDKLLHKLRLQVRTFLGRLCRLHRRKNYTSNHFPYEEKKNHFL